MDWIEGITGRKLKPEKRGPKPRMGIKCTVTVIRLKAFQVAGKPINKVRATAEEVANEAWKFSSKNGGVSVKVRGGGL